MADGSKTHVEMAEQGLSALQEDLLKSIGQHAIARNGDPSLGDELLRRWDARFAQYLEALGLKDDAERIRKMSQYQSAATDWTVPEETLGGYVAERNTILRAIIADIKSHSAEWEERLNQKSSPPPLGEDAAGAAVVEGRRVFVVHGHDAGALHELVRLLHKLDLEPIVLQEQPDEGMMILEKFEAYADVSFAVVLLTPDDECGSERRARQNVVLELGYFFGRLGRPKVRALFRGGVTLPSDILGWLYVKMDDEGAWRFKLATEIRASGLQVDLNQL